MNVTAESRPILHDYELKVQALRTVQEVWAKTSVEGRLIPVRKMRQILCGESERFVEALCEENGKTELESLSQEVVPVLDALYFLEKNAARILADQPVKLQTKMFFFRGKECAYYFEPHGVIGILGTWNYPFFLNLTQILFAVTAGNAVLLKASEASASVTQEITDLLKQSGYPHGLVEAISAGSPAGEALVRAKCDKYILTGSRQTGKVVSRLLGDDLKPAVMELSGVDPYVILSDADWPMALKTLLWASFQYAGQTCAAPRRIYVLNSDREKFLAEMAAMWKTCRSFTAEQVMLRSPVQAKIEREKIEALKAEGAELLFGEAAVESDSTLFVPQIYTGIATGDLDGLDFMAPVNFVFFCESEEDIQDQVNRSDYALGASVWTRDRVKGNVWARRIKAGQVWVNDSLFSVALGEVPFGGVKDSGFGKTRGADGLLEMAQKKFVGYDFRKKRFKQHLPPYQKNSYAVLNQIQRLMFLESRNGRLKAMLRLLRALALRR